MFCLSLEFYDFDDIEVTAEKHKSIDSHDIKGEWKIVESGNSLMLIFDWESTIMLEDYFKLIFIHVNHFQGFFQEMFLLLKG